MTGHRETFKEWASEKLNKEFLDHYNVDLFAAQRIWDAAKVAAANDLIQQVLDGTLIVNPRIWPPQYPENDL